MATSVDEKIRGFKTPGQLPGKPGIILPKAFAALTKRAFASIPEGARVCCEQNINGGFYLSWFDSEGRELNATATREEIDLSPVHESARVELLRDISTDDLHAEILRREHIAAQSESSDASKKSNNGGAGY